MKTKLVLFVFAVVVVAALAHAVEKSKVPPSSRVPVAGAPPPVMPSDGPIAAPTFFHASGPMAASSTTLDLSWMDNSNNEGNFNISRKIVTGSSYPNTPLAVLPANTTKYHDSGLEPETTYTYILAASRGTTWSTATEATATTNPRPPKNLQAQALGPKRARLTWLNKSNTADLIMLERSTGNNSSFQKIFQTQAGATPSYEDVGLAPQTQYFYRLVALKLPFQASDYTTAVAVTTLPQ
jgi:hypothetical protein